LPVVSCRLGGDGLDGWKGFGRSCRLQVVSCRLGGYRPEGGAVIRCLFLIRRGDGGGLGLDLSFGLILGAAASDVGFYVFRSESFGALAIDGFAADTIGAVEIELFGLVILPWSRSSGGCGCRRSFDCVLGRKPQGRG
jgi:hypothetical protein